MCPNSGTQLRKNHAELFRKMNEFVELITFKLDGKHLFSLILYFEFIMWNSFA